MTRRVLLSRTTRAAAIVAAGIPLRGERATYGDIVGEQFQSANLVGLQAGVIENGRFVWAEAYGFADVGRRIAMTPDTIINIASVSKTVTATAVMQLCEDRLLSLDDDINRHLPFAVRNPFHSSKTISVRHLLTHTSSIADGPAYAAAYVCGDARLGLREWLSEYLLPSGRYYARSNYHPWEPGERFEYSNVAFGLLGLAVEAISRQPFADFCARNIFQPLGMGSTSFSAKVPSGRLATPYIVDAQGQPRDRVVRDARSPVLRLRGGSYLADCLYSFPNFPDGLVRTTVRDFSRFVSAVLPGGESGGHRILKEPTIREFFHPQFEGAGRPVSWPAAQGLAWYALRGPNDSLIWLHAGADPGVRTVVMCHLPSRCAALMFANTGPADSLTDLAGTCLRRAAGGVEGPKVMKPGEHPGASPSLIMTWEEYARQPARTPCVLKLRARVGALLYYGARHTFSSRDPQIAEIELLWNDFRPTLAFSEGGVRPASATVAEAVRRYGEPGFVRLLADRHRVKIQSIEPPHGEEIGAMLREWPPDRVKLYYFLRAMMGYRHGAHDHPVKDYAMAQLKILNQTRGIDGPLRTLDEVEAALAKLGPPLTDWRGVPESLFDPTRSEAFTNEFTRKLSLFRDEHMLTNIVAAVRGGERVFAVVGSAHVVMQERALKAVFS